jgi:hypothetical protein
MTIQLTEYMIGVLSLNLHVSSELSSKKLSQPNYLVRTRGWRLGIVYQHQTTAYDSIRSIKSCLYSTAQVTGSAITDQ